MEYRKKPVVIEAFRYGMDSRPDWFDTKVTSNEIITYVGTDIRDSSQYYCEIKTLEGIMRGNCGDYIIKGVQGEVYPCKPDIFEMTYEIASTSSQTLKENHIVDTNEMVEDTFKVWECCGMENCICKGSDDHIVDTNEMVKRGTLKKRMDKDAWFVVFQSNAYNESDMAYELIKSQEIDIDMYDVYKDGDEVTFELVKKKWAKITPFLYPLKTTSSQTEISDEEIEEMLFHHSNEYAYGFKDAIQWYREQLKSK